MVFKDWSYWEEIDDDKEEEDEYEPERCSTTDNGETPNERRGLKLDVQEETGKEKEETQKILRVKKNSEEFHALKRDIRFGIEFQSISH